MDGVKLRMIAGKPLLSPFLFVRAQTTTQSMCGYYITNTMHYWILGGILIALYSFHLFRLKGMT